MLVKMRNFSDNVPETLAQCRQLYINMFIFHINWDIRHAVEKIYYCFMDPNRRF